MIKNRTAIDILKPYVPGKPIDDVKRELGLSVVHKLASNENPYGCSQNAKKAVINLLDDASSYPDGNCTLIREALADEMKVNGNQIVFGTGTDEVISMIGKVFVEEGDECITADTTFSQYYASVQSIGGKMIYALMREHGFDLQKMADMITAKTKIIFIANPNNPTGTYHTENEQLEFLEKVPQNVLVVIDEAYSEFVDKDDYPNTLQHMKKFKNVMLLKTFSKIYGLASLRIGYGIADESIISKFEQIRNPFNVSSAAQMAAYEAIKDKDFIKFTFENNKRVKDYCYDRMKELNLSYIPSQTNFFMLKTNQDSMVLFKKLMAKGYIIRPGTAFGMQDYLRVSIGTMAQMVGFFDALRDVLK